MFEKKVLSNVELCYSLSAIAFEGRSCLISSTENRDGDAVLVFLDTFEQEHIKGLSGGVMNIVPVPWEEGCFYAIERFYPVFDSKAATVSLYRLTRSDEGLSVAGQKVADIPYVHRIALFTGANEIKLYASTLCSGKDFVEDWSKPGALYCYTLNSAGSEVTGIETIIAPLTHNHGLYHQNVNGKQTIYVSADEGVFAVNCEDNSYSLVLGRSVSDICLYDLDGDGLDELVTIEPFHGDNMVIYKQAGNEYLEKGRHDIHFGHALSGVTLNGKGCVVACSRGGDKKTELLTLNQDLSVDKVDDIDCGAGAANIIVVPGRSGAKLFACNHAIGEISQYDL